MRAGRWNFSALAGLFAGTARSHNESLATVPVGVGSAREEACMVNTRIALE